MLSLPQVDLGDGFEIHIPQSDAAVSSSRSKSFFAGMHAEDPCLNNVTGKKNQCCRQVGNKRATARSKTSQHHVTTLKTWEEVWSLAEY